MADKVSKEEARYKPFVLRRLTDYEPGESVERELNLLTGKQVKEDIFENLDMLFNSRSHAGFADLGGSEEAESSVLGYGVTDFCGRQTSTASREELRANILSQIRRFEPRLDPASVSIELLDRGAGDTVSIEFKISGSIRTKEVNEEIAFVSRLNFESGAAELRVAAN